MVQDLKKVCIAGMACIAVTLIFNIIYYCWFVYQTWPLVLAVELICQSKTEKDTSLNGKRIEIKQVSLVNFS